MRDYERRATPSCARRSSARLRTCTRDARLRLIPPGGDLMVDDTAARNCENDPRKQSLRRDLLDGSRLCRFAFASSEPTNSRRMKNSSFKFFHSRFTSGTLCRTSYLRNLLNLEEKKEIPFRIEDT